MTGLGPDRTGRPRVCSSDEVDGLGTEDRRPSGRLVCHIEKGKASVATMEARRCLEERMRAQANQSNALNNNELVAPNLKSC